jgi:hypothetical protein
MSQNSSWAKLVSNSNIQLLKLDPSAEADDQNPWQKVEVLKSKKGKNASWQKKTESSKTVSFLHFTQGRTCRT